MEPDSLFTFSYKQGAPTEHFFMRHLSICLYLGYTSFMHEMLSNSKESSVGAPCL